MLAIAEDCSWIVTCSARTDARAHAYKRNRPTSSQISAINTHASTRLNITSLAEVIKYSNAMKLLEQIIVLNEPIWFKQLCYLLVMLQFYTCFSQACQKTCYQRHVIERCGCSDAYYPADNASAFNYVNVPVCSISNITQGVPLLITLTSGIRSIINSNTLL